jgi:hypothetical protein
VPRILFVKVLVCAAGNTVPPSTIRVQFPHTSTTPFHVDPNTQLSFAGTEVMDGKVLNIVILSPAPTSSG